MCLLQVSLYGGALSTELPRLVWFVRQIKNGPCCHRHSIRTGPKKIQSPSLWKLLARSFTDASIFREAELRYFQKHICRQQQMVAPCLLFHRNRCQIIKKFGSTLLLTGVSTNIHMHWIFSKTVLRIQNEQTG